MIQEVEIKSPSKLRYFPPLAIVPFFFVFYLMLNLPLGSDDFFYQFKSGEFLFRTGHILRENLFSFTAPHFPWVNHAWGSGAFFYLIAHHLGLRGMRATGCFLFLGAAWIYFKSLKTKITDYRLLFVLTSLFSVLLGWQYDIFRPWTFSNPVFLLQIVLWLKKEKSWKTCLASLALLLLWVNLHGSYPVGILVFLLTVWDTPAHKKPLWWIAGLLAPLASPGFLETIWIPLRFMGNYSWSPNSPTSHLVEWQGFFHVHNFVDAMDVAVVLGLVSILFWTKKGAKGTKWIYLLASTTLVFQAKRHFYFFFAGNTLIFSDEIQRAWTHVIPEGETTSWPDRLGHWILYPLGLVLVSFAGMNTQPLLNPQYWPPGLIQYFQDNQENLRAQRVFWDFDFSNIPIYRDELQQKVFFDSREYCYPAEVIQDFYAAIDGTSESTLRIAQKWDVHYFVLKKGSLLDRKFNTAIPAVYTMYEDTWSRVVKLK